jgi:hypothetical protein
MHFAFISPTLTQTARFVRFQGTTLQDDFTPSPIPCWHRRDPDVTATRAKVLDTLFPEGASTLFIGPAPVQLLDHRLAQLKRELQKTGGPQAADTPPPLDTLRQHLEALNTKYPIVGINPELRDPVDRKTMTFHLGIGPVTARLQKLLDSSRLLKVLYPELPKKIVWNWRDDPPTPRHLRYGTTPVELQKALGEWFTKPAEEILQTPPIQALLAKPCVVDFSNVSQGNYSSLNTVLTPLANAVLPGSVITVGTTDYCVGTDTVSVLKALGFQPLARQYRVRTKLGKRWLKRHRRIHGFRLPKDTQRVIPAFIKPTKP